MKYLKLYENINTYWIVCYSSNNDNTDYELYTDKISAENSIINYVNSLIREWDSEYDTDDLVLNVDDAIDYYDETHREEGYYLDIEEISIENNVILDKEVEQLIQIKKYNL